MSRRSKIYFVTTMACACAFFASDVPHATAHKGAKGIVKERMDAMKSIGDSMKAIKKMLQGEMTYDSAKVKKAAGTIKAHAGEPLTKLFPKDSLQKPTEATPKIWEDWEGFKASAMRLRDYAGALENSADRRGAAAEASGLMATIQASDITEDGWPSVTELDQMPTQVVFMAVGKTCKSCHESYRIKKDDKDDAGHKGHGDQKGHGDHKTQKGHGHQSSH